MRVIETFVTSVPREEIPDDAKWFMQDKNFGALMYQIGGTSPKISQNGHLIFTDVKCDVRCHDVFPVSSDAAETVVTREELMRAYDLVEQGYTLWFGGGCPVERGTLVDVVTASNTFISEDATNCFWGLNTRIIAYHLSRSIDKDVAVSMPCVSRPTVKFYETVTDQLETRLKKLDNITGGVWPVSDDEKLLVTADNQLIRFEPEKLITRAQWDDYVSRKIRVGDKVLAGKGTTVHEVLFIGENTCFTRNEHGFEGAILTSRLTRIPQ